ncbi:outer membrane lipoprotein carrier protein LolA [soil metagenome]
MKKFVYACLLSALLVVSFGHAQDLSSDEVLANLKTAAETLQDASFLLTGNLTDPDGTQIALEVAVQVLPSVKAARAEFIQPDALADNFIVLNGDAVYNYVFLTNQATIFPTDDPDALGGLFPDGNVDQGFDFTFNPEQLFRGWTSSVTGYEESPVGNVYTMRFVNEEPDALVVYVDASIVEAEWRPYTMTFYSPEDEVLVDLTLEDFARDQGLDPTEVTYIPDDAELIDER